ncbi:MAG: Replicative superfamily II helicase BRR2 [Candidatus Methanohalarchaeum thermophilum]|uniref:ATP-dependent DNA helicase Hel308 n=1 Tax=Methanohalarchaeum thermophilum TaxID=1903181 RepID=A0A1Q6DU39_METT1|nr:MAG: Replicative superfamily II helicase BRR2 [Candidatus Methanohalarchaeum thermophilum]
MYVSELNDRGLSKRVIDLLEEEGIMELYPPQIEAVEKGVLDKENLVASVPTASGKTFIAKLGMLNSILSGGRALYIVPLRALASEKYKEFKELEELGLNVGISTGDYDRSAEYLEGYDLIVTTSEKADSMLRTGTSWISNLDVIVADEVHLINSKDRGPTLEVTLAKLIELNPNSQVIALSATISNAKDISNWLDAELIKDDWRPVELKQGVLYGNSIEFPFHGSKKLNSSEKDKATSLAKDTVKNDGQALIFACSRRNSKTAARRGGKAIREILSEEEKNYLKKVSKEILGVGEPNEEAKKLARDVKWGAAFHHAGLLAERREIIEREFKERNLKVISATPTLAWGVNLPARRVIIRSYKRYDSNYGMKPIPVLEIKQMLGRAGRPGLDPYGESILIAKNRREKDALIDQYIIGDAEDITSKLASEPALRTQILSLFSSGFTRNRKEVYDFLDKTFYSMQNAAREINVKVDKVIDFLIEERFLVEEDYLRTTALGDKISKLYIDPKSASIILEKLSNHNFEGDIDFLHMICETPDMNLLYMKKSDYSWVKEFISQNERLKEGKELEDWFFSEIKTAMLLKDWIDEKSDSEIIDRFGVSAGDIRSKSKTAEWLMHAAAELSEESASLYIEKMRGLQNRLKYGIKEELLPLIDINGIGRVRARNLFKNNYKSISKLRKADLSELKEIEGIGEKVAKKIKENI